MADNSSIQAPEGYTPLSPDQKTQWNGFASYLGKQNAGPELDANPDLGHAYMQQYANKNPDFKLTADQIPHIQYEQQQLRSGNSPIASLGNDSYYARKTSAPNGQINSLTANSFYPTVATRDSKGKVITDYGTDVDKFAAENPGAIAGGGKEGKGGTTPTKTTPTSAGKTSPEPEEGKAAPAPVNPIDKDVLQWTQNYINSPKYKERLGNFYQHPDLVQGARAEKMKDTGFTESTKAGSDYTDTTQYPNQMNVNPRQNKYLGATRAEAVAHELGHGTNQGESGALRLNPVEENYILKRTKGLDDSAVNSFTNEAKEKGSTISAVLKGSGETHDFAPSENMSDIQGLRYLMSKKKIYDAGTQDLTPELLQKAKADPDIKNSFIGKRLFSNFKDEDLMDIMNKVAFNDKPSADRFTA